MFANYLKIAWKVMLRRRFFTFVSLFGIAFTMIVIMVVASLFDHTFGPHAPESKLNRMIGVYFANMTNKNHFGYYDMGGYKLLDKHLRRLQPVEAMSIHSVVGPGYCYQNGRAQSFFLKRTDESFWHIFDFTFLEGGPFNQRDDDNRNFVAVINRSTRDALFGAGSSGLGRSVTVDGQTFRIVGVVKDVPFLRATTFSDIWAPISTAKTDAYRSEIVGNFFGTIVVKNRADIPVLRSRFAGMLRQVELPPEWDKLTAGLDSPFEALAHIFFGRDQQESQPGKLLGVLFGAMFLFMLLPTVNLVNINLSRILERSSEIGVRKAFGASSRVLVGQFVVENVVLTLVGSAIGLLGSALVLRLLTISALIPYAEFTMNYRIFGFAVAVALMFGVLSGVYPAWRMSRLHPVEALRGGVR
jgi:putative ABC transport system permease protein